MTAELMGVAMASVCVRDAAIAAAAAAAADNDSNG